MIKDKHTLKRLNILIAILFGILLFNFVTLSTDSSRRESSRQTTCTSNQKQIALLIIIHAQEDDYKLPAQEDWIKDVTKNGEISGRTLKCPSGADKKRICSYGYNGHLSGLSVKKFNDKPDRIVLTADSDKDNFILQSTTDISPRHAINSDRKNKNRAIISFVDTHVEAVKTDNFDKIELF